MKTEVCSSLKLVKASLLFTIHLPTDLKSVALIYFESLKNLRDVR